MKNVGLEQSRASNRLASGYRINSAADDAAGLAISETMRAQIRGLDQASRNSQDGQAMLQTTEGGLEEIGNMLQRTRELVVQMSNDTNTQEQREMARQEINQLAQEIGSMQQRVEFNTNRVLAMGSTVGNGVTLNTTDVVSAMGDMETIRNQRSAAVAARDAALAINGALTSLNSARDAGDDITVGMIQGALMQLGFANTIPPEVSSMADWTPGVNAMFAASNQTGQSAHLAITTPAADTDISATEIAAFATRASELNDRIAALDALLQTGNDTVLPALMASAITTTPTDNSNIAFFQVGANSGQGIEFDFHQVAEAVAVSQATVQLVDQFVARPVTGTGIGNGIEVSPFISAVQNALDGINSVRANLGAMQNRMDYTMRSLDISSENLSDSESRVRNADMAREMMRFTMSNVLQQASISMLSQANQMPNNLLQILR